MKHLLFTLLIGLLFAKTFGQYAPQEIIDIISQENLKKHLTVLASDVMLGRKTAEIGQRRASAYLVEQFNEMGVQPIVFNAADSSLGFTQEFRLKKIFGGLTLLPKSATTKSGKNVLSSNNVMGFVEGTDKKDEVLVISAHYDHVGIGSNGEIFNGADDDGSGTTTVLTLAKAFVEAKKKGTGPRRSVLFLLFSGEEQGLFGSNYYTDNPIIPLTNTIADLNIDMVGRIDNEHINAQNYVYVIGSDKISKDLHHISESTNDATLKLQLDYTYNDINHPLQIYYRSDHYNFAKHNIPIIFYFDGEHPDYHQPTDDVDKIDFELLQRRARLIFFTAWEIVNRENTLR